MEHNYKNKYGTDLAQLQSKLQDSSAARRFMKHAASGKLMAFAHAVEKYNHDIYDEKLGKHTSPPGPPWDVEGHTNEDIYVHLPMNPFSRSFIPDYITKIKRWVGDSYEDNLEKSWSIKNVKAFLWWLWAMRCWLYPHHQYWAFVIDSFESYKSYLAEEVMEERLGDHRKVLDLMRKDYVAYQKMEQDIIAELTDEVMAEKLKPTHDRLNSYLWVEKNDPTCMIVNEKIRKFDLKDGWSDGEMLANIERWFYWIANMRVKVVDSKGKCEWLS